ncbi:unnamed protein product [Triticum turgidum subsp. durum]|uniref:glutamine synthetase n=1 Tax=Triticum turgidum subsp. durum TaxID=4567 RepID=A0A9R0T9F6_TRITD|nr:unnamed protein product [Triticum turgidum subsp. durum]
MASLADLVNLDLSDCTDKIIVEYLWVGGSGIDIRSKARTVNGPITDASQLPKWNYDGSSTGQAPGEDSEVILYPQAIFKDPFRRGDNLLVMCDCYTPQGVPIPTNKRHNAAKIFNTPKVAAEETWYGIEQEYTLLQKDVNWPLGWPIGGYPGPQGPYYCAAGADKAFGRDIVDAHYKACLYAGINISGINGEVMPGQWEFQVGPSVGIAASDQLQHQVDAGGRRVRGDQDGHREAGQAARAAHRRLRRGQRAPPHGPPRDRRHQHLQVGRGGPRRVRPRGPRHREGRQGLLRGPQAGLQHGPLRRHLHDRRDHAPPLSQ